MTNPIQIDDGFVRIYRADAYIKDKLAMHRLLKPLPDAKMLRETVANPAYGWCYRDGCDFLFCSDGEIATVITIAGVDIKSAIVIRALFDAVVENSREAAPDKAPEVSVETIYSIVEAVTGNPAQSVQ